MDASIPFRPAAAELDRALVIRNLRKEYRAGQPVLRDVSLTVEARGMTAIIGPSGTGKSTLIRCINRLIDPTSGERSEEHTFELQSHSDLVCRLLLEKKKK